MKQQRKKAKQTDVYGFVIHRHYRDVSSTLQKSGKFYHPVVKSTKANNVDLPPQKPAAAFELKECRLDTISSPHDNKMLCSLLCNFPKMVEDSEVAAKLLLLIFLSQIADIAFANSIQLPILELSTSTTPPVLNSLLEAVQGEPIWCGKKFWLNRPWVIGATQSTTESKPSEHLWDYIGGEFENEYGKRRKFHFAHSNATLVLLPTLPSSIFEKFYKDSIYCMPLVYHNKKGNSTRYRINLDGSGLYPSDKDEWQKFEEAKTDIYSHWMEFMKWFYRKEKHAKNWQREMEAFRLYKHINNSYVLQTGNTQELFYASLSLLKQYLFYACEKRGWITTEQRQATLDFYWKLILPDSYQSKNEEPEEILDYSSPEVFSKFLIKYLEANKEFIQNENRASANTLGLICEIRKEKLLIFERQNVWKSYCEFLQNISPNTPLPNNAATMQRSLVDAKIPLKTEGKSNKSTWRYNWAQKNIKEKVTDKDMGKTDCTAIFLEKLPQDVFEEVQKLFGDAIVNKKFLTQSEETQTNDKEVKPYETNVLHTQI